MRKIIKYILIIHKGLFRNAMALRGQTGARTLSVSNAAAK